MAKKRGLEADLDPPNTRHTRPGSKTADVALRNSRLGAKRKRPGTTAAKRKRAR